MTTGRPALPRRLAGRPLASLRRFARDGRAVAAVEFALVVPVMITMLIGMSEVTMGIATDRKLVSLSRSIVDLASRVSSISTADMANIFAASTATMQPYDTTSLKMVLSSIKVTQSGSNYIGTVDWSCAKGTGATARAKNTTYTVPGGFQTANSYFLIAETSMSYKPTFGWTLTGTIYLKENTPWPVRNVAQVTGPSSCPS